VLKILGKEFFFEEAITSKAVQISTPEHVKDGVTASLMSGNSPTKTPVHREYARVKLVSKVRPGRVQF